MTVREMTVRGKDCLVNDSPDLLSGKWLSGKSPSGKSTVWEMTVEEKKVSLLFVWACAGNSLLNCYQVYLLAMVTVIAQVTVGHGRSNNLLFFHSLSFGPSSPFGNKSSIPHPGIRSKSNSVLILLQFVLEVNTHWTSFIAKKSEQRIPDTIDMNGYAETALAAMKYMLFAFNFLIWVSFGRGFFLHLCPIFRFYTSSEKGIGNKSSSSIGAIFRGLISIVSFLAQIGWPFITIFCSKCQNGCLEKNLFTRTEIRKKKKKKK